MDGDLDPIGRLLCGLTVAAHVSPIVAIGALIIAGLSGSLPIGVATFIVFEVLALIVGYLMFGG